MAYETLKNSIKQAIKQNGNQEITGDVMQTTLLNIVNEMGQEKMFKGFAVPSTNPGIPKNDVFYFASEPGTYSNFKINDENECVITGNGLYLIYNTDYDGHWDVESLVEVTQTLGDSENKVPSQKVVLNELLKKQNNLGLLDEVSLRGKKYTEINEFFVDVLFLPLSGDSSLSPAPCIINSIAQETDRQITFFNVDNSGHYTSPVGPKSFRINLPTNKRGYYLYKGSVAYGDGSASWFVYMLLNLNIEIHIMAYVPIKFSDKVFSNHKGPLQDILFDRVTAPISADYNRFYPLVNSTAFLSHRGTLSGDASYQGYMSDFIPVVPGETYLCFTNFTGYNGAFEGNIYGYENVQNGGAVVLGGGIQSYKQISEITIPNNIFYIRACSNILNPVPFIIPKNSFSEVLLKEMLSFIEVRDRGLIGLDKVLNGKKITYVSQPDLIVPLILQRFISFKNPYSLTLNFTSTTSDEWFRQEHNFTPTGKNLVHIKFKVILNEEAKKNQIAVWVANQVNYVSNKSFIIAHIADSGEYDVTFDPAYYAVYKGFSDFNIWLAYKAETTGRVVIIENFEVFELEEPISGNNLSGSTVKELFSSVNSSIDSLQAKIDSQGAQNLKSPSGKEFKLSVGDDGTIYSIPLVPEKGYFFGNSLIIGSGFGMAASDNQHDYYYLINNFIKTQLNNSYTYNKSSGTSLEGLENESLIDSSVAELVNKLSGDETLVSIQLGDNVNTDAKNKVFPKSSLALCKAIRSKCPRARVVWMGMWYSSQLKYKAIKNACDKTGCQFISYEDIKGPGTSNIVGGLQKQGRATRNIATGIATEVNENSSTNITVTLSVGGQTYTSTLDVYSYSFSTVGGLTYESDYSIITSPGVASHPGDEGFRRIANKFLYETGLSADNEYYKK